MPEVGPRNSQVNGKCTWVEGIAGNKGLSVYTKLRISRGVLR